VESLAQLLPFILIFVVFWFFLIRPQRNRQRELARMQSSLKVGDEVMLGSGIFGTVAEAGDTTVLVTIADGVTVKVARGAIGQVVSQGSEPEEGAEPGAGDDTVNLAKDEAEEK
jgi:preprotein translocase subunit YajC